MTLQRISAIVTVCFWAALAPATAQPAAERCVEAMATARAAAGGPDVGLTIDHAPVFHDFTRGRDHLAALIFRHGSADASARMGGRRVHGLTHSALGYHLGAAFDVQALNDGTWCLWPRSVTADLGFTETTIYVADVYPPGTCPFEAVLAHEEEHVAINLAVVDDHAPRLRDTLARLATDAFPLAGRDPLALQEQAQDALDAGFLSALDPLLVDRANRNAAIDTEPGYRSLNAQCQRW